VKPTRLGQRTASFTGIVDEDLEKLETARGSPFEGYDLILNGYEARLGSIRLHRQECQERLFKALGSAKNSCVNASASSSMH